MDPLNITGGDSPEVPVYACVVYLVKQDDGTVVGRVANLDGIEAKGASERFVLSAVTREFKKTVAKLTESGAEIPWNDPVQPPQPNEQVRSIPIHL